ncbi:MupG family TIM beta-alpha barrel fold protein [Listeria costaricensis]|uniref:MupG family TIM beta-alpha barrel fold protein n=1 Tax=Listeria costaricensis TaxID=2026604 RepID=UPI000C07F32B|nr:MupG family TIM beta-alpha barrel fold protein [Listeria costaricensis]
MFGVSVYLQDLEKIEERLAREYQAGFRSIFSSLHIMEEDASTYQEKLARLGRAAQMQDMALIMDISEESLAYLGLSFEEAGKIVELGVTGLRIDYGIGADKVALLTHEIAVYLNASTIDKATLAELRAYGADFERLEAFHNYYPKTGTGLSHHLFQQKNQFLQENGLKISAFVPGDAEKRQPLYEGLPTIEAHRTLSPYAGALELLKLGVDHLYVGDPELAAAHLDVWQGLIRGEIHLKGQATPGISTAIQAYLEAGDQNRVDEARDFIRLEKSRLLFGQADIEPQPAEARSIGAITIDNRQFGRYQGEIMIAKRALAADARTNIIGQLYPPFIDMLPFISGGDRIYIHLDN